MVFAKTFPVRTNAFAVQGLVVSIVIIIFLNVCRIHVYTGVLAKMMLTILHVCVLQVTKVCKAGFVQVSTFLTNTFSIPGNFCYWKSWKLKKTKIAFIISVF